MAHALPAPLAHAFEAFGATLAPMEQACAVLDAAVDASPIPHALPPEQRPSALRGVVAVHAGDPTQQAHSLLFRHPPQDSAHAHLARLAREQSARDAFQDGFAALHTLAQAIADLPVFHAFFAPDAQICTASLRIAFQAAAHGSWISMRFDPHFGGAEEFMTMFLLPWRWESPYFGRALRGLAAMPTITPELPAWDISLQGASTFLATNVRARSPQDALTFAAATGHTLTLRTLLEDTQESFYIRRDHTIPTDRPRCPTSPTFSVQHTVESGSFRHHPWW